MSEYIILSVIYFTLIIACILLILEGKRLERLVNTERIRANNITKPLWLGIRTVWMYPATNIRRASEDYDEWCMRVFGVVDPNAESTKYILEIE